MTAPRVVERAPTVAEYRALRAAVGWSNLDEPAVEQGLAGALFSVCVEEDGRAVACARIVGDGGIYFYLQDVVVLPEYQGRGYGAALMEEMLDFLRRHARPGAFVGLMAAAGASDFYLRYGFRPRPEGRPGMYRVWSADDAIGRERA